MTNYKLILNNEIIPITNLFDYKNNEVYDWDEALKFVAGPMKDGNWLAGLTLDYQYAKII
jgi:hypothetical protein